MTTAVAAMAVFGAAVAPDGTEPARGVRQTAADSVVIPFSVGPGSCADRARRYVVTMRIYNVLAQPVGIPILLRRGDADQVPGAAGRPLTRLALACGRYEAFWNGRHVTTGRPLAPGTYLYDLVVDGQRITRKFTLGR